MAKNETAAAPTDPRRERLNSLSNLTLTAHALIKLLGVAENEARVAATRLTDFDGRQVEEELARQIAFGAAAARQAFAHIAAAQAHLDLALRAEADARVKVK